MSSPSYFEDFEIGTTQEFGEYQVTEEEIIEFAEKYDPQPFHLSDAAGKCISVDFALLDGIPAPWLCG